VPLDAMSQKKEINVSRRAFERMMIRLYGYENLEVRDHPEETADGIVQLALYYDKSNLRIDHINGEAYESYDHIGTWQKSGAWYNQPKVDVKGAMYGWAWKQIETNNIKPEMFTSEALAELLQWNDPNGCYMSPEDDIPITKDEAVKCINEMMK